MQEASFRAEFLKFAAVRAEDKSRPRRRLLRAMWSSPGKCPPDTYREVILRSLFRKESIQAIKRFAAFYLHKARIVEGKCSSGFHCCGFKEVDELFEDWPP